MHLERRKTDQQEEQLHSECSSSPNYILLQKLLDECQIASSNVISGVVKVSQLDDWDCGVACVLSVLRTVKNRSSETSTVPQDLLALHSLLPRRSLWSIELAYLLRKFGVWCMYTTTCIGVNEEYFNDLDFYAEDKHEQRDSINRLFWKAEEEGVFVYRYSVTSHQLKNILLSGEYLVIALVDKSALVKQTAATSRDSSQTSYRGHYILLYGYDSERGLYYVKDPAVAEETVLITDEAIDCARTSYGTDEDLILVGVDNTSIFQGSPLRSHL